MAGFGVAVNVEIASKNVTEKGQNQENNETNHPCIW
jgi:hypothetical protein